MHEAGSEEIVVGKREAISVGVMDVSVIVGDGDGDAVSIVAVGEGRLKGSVGGMRVGVAGEGKVSASERKIPPTTRMIEKIAIITPAPNWRRFCMITPPYA
ncbi:MAG TPA: hypothetical protein VFM35_01930 [Candidatus Binatia bacterium]|nr:hypothetical protein [Candidatus Binatia bacterium]